MSKKVEQEFRKGLLGVRIKAHDALSRVDPEYFRALKRHYIELTVNMKDAILPRKIKETIMAIAAARNGRRGVELRMRYTMFSSANPRDPRRLLDRRDPHFIDGSASAGQ